jgi:hypothetical protein
MTKTQRAILTYVAENGGQMLIYTGYKQTRKATLPTTGERCIATSLVVLPPLVQHGWLEHIDPDPRVGGLYRLTELGRAAIAPRGDPAKWPLRRVGRLPR